MLAVTFTNKAAEEMRQRVAGLLGHDVRGLWISTFHALCAKLLRREGPAIGLGRDFVIYDSADQQSAIKQALKDVNADDKLIPPRMALSRISQAKNQMQGPEAMAGSSSLELPRPADRQGLRALRRDPEGERRRRLRRPAAQDGGAVRQGGARPQALRHAVPATSRSTSTRTPTGRSTCWCSSSRRCTATSRSSAIPTSRSTSGAARM